MDQIGTIQPDPHPFEKKENPQTYDILPLYGEHPRPSQHMLGIVGGNEAPYKNRQSQVELESDLRGITRANTFCPARQHQAPWSRAGGQSLTSSSITRDTPKEKVTVPVYSTPLKQSQMWAYPATIAPEPFVIETCNQPHKY